MSSIVAHALENSYKNILIRNPGPSIFGAMTARRTWIDTLSDGLFEVSFDKTLRHQITGYGTNDRASGAICAAIGTSQGMFSDYAAARHGCGSGGQRYSTLAAATGELAEQAPVNVNYAWEAVQGSAFLSADQALGEFAMSITGTVIVTAPVTDGSTDTPEVRVSEAHDSGLCSASAATKTRFARDVLNLTLANPRVNRYEKGAKDAAEWQPQRNACWFANRTLEVRRKYGLSIDRREAIAIENTLAGCASTEMVVLECGLPAETRNTAQPPRREIPIDALERWDDNRNGQITCAEARRGRGRNVGATRPRSVPAIATIATR